MADDAPKPSKAPRTPPPKPVQVGGESFLDRITPHIKKIAVVTGIVAVIVSVVFGVRAFKQRGEKKATAKLAQVIAIADRRVRDAGEAVDPKKPADDSFADEKAKATAVLAAIAANDVKAPPQFEGPFLVTVGRYDDAITGYHTCQTLAEGLDGVICREGLGLALEAKAAATTDLAAQKAGYQAALEAFKVMQPDADGPRAAIAKYHEGRMQELLGNATEAKAAFEKAKTMDKDGGELGALIEARLATLGA